MGQSGCYFINMEYDNLNLHKSFSLLFQIHPSHLESYRRVKEKQIQQVSLHFCPFHTSINLIEVVEHYANPRLNY